MTAKHTRMSIDIPVKDHKRIKVIAAAEGITLREFVIDCIHERIYPPNHPNLKTRNAIDDARKGKTTRAKSFDELCDQLGL